ncbi:MAG: hypothetical protein JO124_02390 [Hyphomicrobiales bacterium]|nr:hypothetical protein [Hyphomicrobiales bacterium]MBV9975005.1 hypothetical protein [Hyphomicrobiales bacterium]
MPKPRKDELDLSALSIEELNNIVFKAAHPFWLVRPASAQILSADRSIDDIGRAITETPDVVELREDFWTRFKNEFRRFVCSHDPKDLRRRKEIFGQNSTYAIVTGVAAQIGAKLGNALLAALVPLCAMALIALLKIGISAFCAEDRWDVTLRPEPTKKKRASQRSLR